MILLLDLLKIKKNITEDKLYDHQVQVCEKLKALNEGTLLFETGCGKTIKGGKCGR